MRDISDIQAVRSGTNLLSEFDRVFLKDSEIPKIPIRSAEGVKFDQADVAIKLLMVADRMHMLKVYFKKGSIIPEHMHPDHSTICWLQTGKLRVHINGETFIASPGDVWQHPRGVPHYHEVIEEGHVIEIKSPASKTW